MLFYPYGQRKGEVADPKNLSREYQNALRLVQRTTHYQWDEGAVDTYDTIFGLSVTTVSVNTGGTSTNQTGVVQVK